MDLLVGLGPERERERDQGEMGLDLARALLLCYDM